METENKTTITIKTLVNAPVSKVWTLWNDPEHVVKWNSASDDWHTPKAENDLTVGKGFLYTMAAKDGSFSFDFEATYTAIEQQKLIEYTLADDRKVKIEFIEEGNQTHIIEAFEAEGENPADMQREGWQAILNNFKQYAESN